MSPIDRFVTGIVVNAAVQACVIAAAAALALRLVRGSEPWARHRLAAIALLLAAALPLATAWRATVGDPEAPAPWPMGSASAVLPVAARPADVVVALFAAVCLWHVLRFGRSAIATSLVRRRAQLIDAGPIYDEALWCFRAWEIAPLRLCTSADVTIPALCG